MSRSKGHAEGRRRGEKQREPGERSGEKQREPDEREAGQRESKREAQEWERETGYRPSVNQQRHEPMPASQHADHRQEAVQRNEEHMRAPVRAAPSRRARRRR